MSAHNEVRISQVTISSAKTYKWVELAIFGSGKYQESKEAGAPVVSFNPPQDLALTPNHTLHIQYRRNRSFSTREIKIYGQALLNSYNHGISEAQEWQEIYGTTKVVVQLKSRTQIPVDNPSQSEYHTDSSALRPTIDELLERCPRFRILVIGKSGAGKSSLINKTFGVSDANVSHDNPGESDIEKEIFSQQNGQFVLHDSLGFEHGEGDTVKLAKDFIKRRNVKPDIKDKLHAIWLCIEAPIASGRLLETGNELFLESKLTGELGDVPLIVVFTKYDRLVTMEKTTLIDAGQKVEPGDLDAKVEQKLKAICVGPFEDFIKNIRARHTSAPETHPTIPHSKVSTNKGYESTLIDLTTLTYDRVCEYLKDASIVHGIAQKVDPGVKIRTSIAVGKAKYWNGLASGAHFFGRKLNDCLDVIHRDIIRVWGFNDPGMLLYSPEFKNMIYQIVDTKGNSGEADGRNVNRNFAVGLSMVGALAGIISSLAGPAAPIVVPIAAGVVVAYWVFELYKQSKDTLKRLMTYIIDLTLIMQTLFCIQVVLGQDQKPVTRGLVGLAYTAYRSTPHKSRLVSDISEYVKDVNVISKDGPDKTFEKIVELIESCRINVDEMLKVERIKNFDISGADEGWGFGNPSGAA